MGDMFLKLMDPDIYGESVDEAVPKSHRKEIEISGWSWELTNPDSKAAEGKDEPTKTNVKSIVVHKHYDASTRTLMQCCANKTNIAKGTITCRKNDGNQKLDYLVIKLNDVKIRTINWPTATDDVVPEDIELIFTEFYVSYKPQSNEGPAIKAQSNEGRAMHVDTATGSIDFGWNIAENKEADRFSFI